MKKFVNEETIETSESTNEQRVKLIARTNHIRSKIRTSFRSFNCFYLPCPVADGTDGKSFEDALLSVDSLNWEKLRDAFKTEMLILRSSVFTKINQKTVNSQTMNGLLFAEYLKNVVIKLNGNKKVYTNEVLLSSMRFLCEIKSE